MKIESIAEALALSHILSQYIKRSAVRPKNRNDEKFNIETAQTMLDQADVFIASQHQQYIERHH